MGRSFDDSRQWVRDGTKLFVAAAEGLGGPSLDEATCLPGWTRRHLLAHVALNAGAVENLVRWAHTGVRTPMYASSTAREENIERWSELPAPDLHDRVVRSGVSLQDAMDELDGQQWQTTVVTAQSRTVPATETPWIRAREVYVHAVDLGTGVTFAELPEPFLAALVAEIAARRELSELPDGPLPDVAAWLAGRPHPLSSVPEIGPWL